MGRRFPDPLDELEKFHPWYKEFVDALVFCYDGRRDIAGSHWTGRFFASHRIANLPFDVARRETASWFLVRMGALGCDPTILPAGTAP